MTRAGLQTGEPGIEIRWHDGPRDHLRELFALAEDSPERLDGYLDLGRVLVAVAGDGGTVVGYTQLVGGEGAGEVELQSMAVAETAQRSGIGRALVERAAAEALADGARTLLVATAAADTGNLRFYQRLGFRLLRVERDAFTAAGGYPDGLVIDGIPLRDRVWLTLALSTAPP